MLVTPAESLTLNLSDKESGYMLYNLSIRGAKARPHCTLPLKATSLTCALDFCPSAMSAAPCVALRSLCVVSA